MIHFWVAVFAAGSALVSGTCIGLMVGRIGLWRERASRKEAEKLNEELWLKIASLDPGDGAYPATADALGDVGDLDDDLHSGSGLSQSATILEFPVERTTTALDDTTPDDLLGTVELPPVAGDGGGEPVPRREITRRTRTEAPA